MEEFDNTCETLDADTSNKAALYAQYSSEYFPRCEYRTRFKKTSAFSMTEPEFWGTYFRSTPRGGNCDRLAKVANKSQPKTYKNSILNESETPVSISGTFNSPWTMKSYKKIFRKDKAKIGNFNANSECLYDDILKYKVSTCNEVIRQFKEQHLEEIKIGVFCRNDYPCIMVQIYDFDYIRGESSSLYLVSMAYLIAITNYVSQKNKIPVELVQRSSFGHNIPSVAEVKSCFRINIGLVPKVYANSLVESLVMFNNQFLVPFSKKTFLKLQFSAEEIKKFNDNIDKYNAGKKNREKTKKAQKVQKWNINEDLRDILFKVGDSGGFKVAHQITRLRKYVDLLTDFVFGEIQANDYSPDFSKPLSNILRILHYDANDLVVTLKVQESLYYETQLEFSENEHPDIAKDEGFWNIIRQFFNNTAFNHSNIADVHDSLGNALLNKKLLGLFDLLDRINVNFITNCTYQQEEYDNCDSDCEIRENNRKLFSKNIIVNTGMRAINAALFLSKYITKSTKIVEETKEFMYYEAENAMNYVCNILENMEYKEAQIATEETTITQIDLTHCSTSELDSELKLHDMYVDAPEKRKVVIFDYTSATTEKIRMYVEKCIVKIPVIILVNSGIKNEQFGADMNPYGTIRIITKERGRLDELYFLLNFVLGDEILPKELHLIRKAYKDAGTVVTNRMIYKDQHVTYKKKQTTVDSSKNVTNISKKKIMKILNTFQNDKLRDILMPLYYVGLQDAMGTFCENVSFTQNELYRFRYSIEKLCDLVEEHEWAADINQLSFQYLKNLLELIYKGDEYTFVNLILFHGLAFDEVLSWDCIKIEFLGSEKIKNIVEVEDDHEYFELISSYYDIDSDILEIVLANYDPFESHHELSSDFATLKEISDNSNYISQSDLEDYLEEIREERMNDSISVGYFEETDSE